MGLRINTNVTSLAAQRALGNTNRDQSLTLEKLSSGSRINRASDDAAGLAISEKLRAEIRGVKQAERNANDGISMVQTAEGGLNEVSSLLTRMRELAVQASSDTVGQRERQFTDLEYQNLKQEIERISQVTQFNGKRLLNGSGDVYDFQVGINNDDFQDRIHYNAQNTNSSIDHIGVGDLSVATSEGAQNSLNIVDEAIQRVSGERAELGAVQTRLGSAIQSLQVSSENLSAANSRIRDTDYAAETAKNTRLSILNQAGTAVLAQSNSVGGTAALKLIG
ncbi:MAG: flagellin FliC [Bdellovibrionales bacterium]|jgi:flagellin|nr:flagellin FliC [Bdellovibrionales bacterium]MBT3526410.1 flagellin FliC [Bdellovibrionales bacterium]MBT7669378.1 flagellin FliC [Bdellovibrionales bacterium]MBT7768130.1 flagellin FliC [Bdellovibrionales bacterium]